MIRTIVFFKRVIFIFEVVCVFFLYKTYMKQKSNLK